jgi:DNA-binding SARP family transcriptional activator
MSRSHIAFDTSARHIARVPRFGSAPSGRLPFPPPAADPTAEFIAAAEVASRLLRKGNAAAAQKVLAEAFAKASGLGLRWGSGWAMRAASSRQAVVRARAAEGPISLLADAEALGVPALPMLQHSWPIRITALGAFEIQIRGVTFTGGVKPQRKPLELLKALLVTNGQGVSAMELADKLWPDSDGDTARNSLQVAIYRLRHLLQSDAAVVVQDRKVMLDHGLCWADLWSFTQQVELALCSQPGDPQFPDRAVAALRLYRGHLFSQEPEQVWMLGCKERLRRNWLCLVKRLGDHYDAYGDLLHAAGLYQEALDIDPLAEEFYRRVMRCQHRTGERAEITNTYRRCRQELRAALGVAPSAETDKVYHALRALI